MSCLLNTEHTLVGHGHPAVKGTLCTDPDCPQHDLCMEEVREPGQREGPLCGQAWNRLEAERQEDGTYARWLVCSAGHRKRIENLTPTKED